MSSGEADGREGKGYSVVFLDEGRARERVPRHRGHDQARPSAEDLEARLIVIMREPVEYLEKVLFDGGQIEEMTIQGSPLTASCYNSKMDLLLADGRVFTLNWSK